MATQHKLDIPMIKSTTHMFNDIVIPKSPKSPPISSAPNKDNDKLPLKSPGITKEQSLQYLATSMSNLSFRSNVSGNYSASLIDRKVLLAGMATESAFRIHEERRHCRTIFITSVLSVSACALVLIFILDIFGLAHDETLITPGLIGLWPTYGGDAMNQQRPPLGTQVIINRDNIHNVITNCTYISDGGMAFSGYITIDEQHLCYFSDGSGYITSVDLDSCTEQWRRNIATLLGYNDNITVVSLQTLTLFQDSTGDKGLIFGTPSIRTSYYDGACFVVAVHLNGSLWWKIQLDDTDDSYLCTTDGFSVDGQYAYGGIARSDIYGMEGDGDGDELFIGRYFKINIDTHDIVDIWYPFDYDLFNHSYAGISMYNFPAIIGDYLIFGTSSLYRIPSYIDRCVSFNEYLLLNDSNYMDICGNDKSLNSYYRCLEKGIYPSSLVILNKNTMELQHGFVLQGLDVSNFNFNSDLTAVAVYADENGRLYVAASQTSARLHVFDIESGTLRVSRKYGPQSINMQYNMAVDAIGMIGITSINGGSRYTLANGMVVCETASIQAFDLRTGNILYQIVNPYGHIDDTYCADDTIWDEYIDYTEKTDTNCEYGEFISVNVNVIKAPIWNASFLPVDAKKRALFTAPVTIVNDMIIIPSDTGDIWIHDLYDGSFIHHFVCPDTQLDDGTWNRAGITGGVSVVNDRIVFYCGGYSASDSVEGNILVSMRLN